MSTGARFLKCDLHMHTPADASNWRGPKMEDSDGQRRAAADAYVERCYQEGLELVAITDHNFLSKDFIPILQESARRLAQKTNFQLTILPGFEIQANVGKGMHVICVFDANADLEQIDRILTECGIPAERRTPTPACLPHSTKDLSHIIDVVQKRAAGRYTGIVTCPHCQAEAGIFDNDRISEFLQPGEFKNPDLLCVEVSKPVADMTASWQRLFRADDGCWPEWKRTRPIACIMCSDAKALTKGDGAENHIGFRYCWIKLANRSVEGLRQAFLAHESRISLSPPSTPERFVRCLEVGACKFFPDRPLRISLNRQFNALIGGRGTGKSTILEYLRWCLCDQPVTCETTDPIMMELPPYAKKRVSLIESTLKNQEPALAYVRVELDLHGTSHVITRYAIPDRITLRIGDGDVQDVTEANVQRLLPIQAYSQKQLSTVAIRVEELRRLVEAPVQQQLLALREKIDAARAGMRRYYSAFWRARQLDSQILAHKAEIASLAAQVKSLKDQITDVSTEDKNLLAAHAGYLADEQTIERVQADVAAMRAILNDVQKRLGVLPRDSSAPENSAQPKIVERIVHLGQRASADASAALERTAATLNACEAELAKDEAEWHGTFQSHQEAYSAAAACAAAYGTQLEQINNLSERGGQVQRALDVVCAERAAIVIETNEESERRRSWIQLHKDRGDVMAAACARLAESSGGDLRAVLKRGGDAEAAFSLLQDRTKGARLRGEWLERLRANVVGAVNPASEWTVVLEEFRLLADIPCEQANTVVLPACPRLDAAGFTEPALRNVATRFRQDDWLDLLLSSLEDEPEFFYVVGVGKEIPFKEASPGQQATALLTILLNQEGGPLLIDQPEDDLDNAVVTKVVQTIWSAKKHRQLIFSSHNANLVVN